MPFLWKVTLFKKFTGNQGNKAIAEIIVFTEHFSAQNASSLSFAVKLTRQSSRPCPLQQSNPPHDPPWHLNTLALSGEETKQPEHLTTQTAIATLSPAKQKTVSNSQSSHLFHWEHSMCFSRWLMLVAFTQAQHWPTSHSTARVTV